MTEFAIILGGVLGAAVWLLVTLVRDVRRRKRDLAERVRRKRDDWRFRG